MGCGRSGSRLRMKERVFLSGSFGAERLFIFSVPFGVIQSGCLSKLLAKRVDGIV